MKSTTQIGGIYGGRLVGRPAVALLLSRFIAQSLHVTPAQAGAYLEIFHFNAIAAPKLREMGPGLRRGDSWWLFDTY